MDDVIDYMYSDSSSAVTNMSSGVSSSQPETTVSSGSLDSSRESGTSIMLPEKASPSEVFKKYFSDINARRTEVEDIPIIQRLVTNQTIKMFGHWQLYDVVEKAVLAITLESSKATIIAHAAFFDYPNLKNIDSAYFDDWIDEYCAERKDVLTPLNSVFLSYFVAMPGIEVRCAFESVKAMFKSLLDVNYAHLIVPRSVCREYDLGEVFDKGFRSQSYDKFSVRYCCRDYLMPKIRIRRARVEDNDNLVELFGKNGDILKAHYGEFFLAELIEQQDSFDVCLVAELADSEVPVGFMSISTNVDINTAEKHFELTAFNNLRKVLQPKVVEIKVEPVKKGRGGDKAKAAEVKPIVTETKPVVDLEPKAFCIHLFVMKEEFESYYMLFVEEAFRVFREKEFCVVSVACWSSGAPFLDRFVQATQKSSVPIPHDMYVLHRWCLLSSSVKVRLGKLSDKANVLALVNNIESHDKIVDDFENACTNWCGQKCGMEMQAFVFECRGQISGVAVVQQEENIEFVRCNFNIDEHIYYGLHRREDHAQVLHFALNPIYGRFSRHFLKEIQRLGRKTCLYIRVYPNAVSGRNRTPLAVVRDFLPVPLRRNPFTFSKLNPENCPSRRCDRPTPEFMLMLLSRKHVLESKVTVRAQILVVGASETAFAILKSFLDGPYVRFTNVHVISEYSVPKHYSENETEGIAIPDNPVSILKELNRPYIELNIGMIHGRLTRIHRSKKFVTVDKKFEVYYDYLLLCCGRQYQLPAVVQKSRRKKRPKCVFTLNVHEDFVGVKSRLSESVSDPGKVVVVYGNTIDAFALVEALLQLGIKGYSIIVIEPSAVIKDYCLQNGILRNIIDFSLEECQVQHYYNCELINLTVVPGSNSVSFQSPTGMVFDVSFHTMFCFTDINVNQDTFDAINDACIVYDGGVVIDSEFRTNDPWIFAAGPITKFSRRYYTKYSPLPYQLSSHKAGSMLASQIHRILNPAFSLQEQQHQFYTNADELMSALRGPIITYGKVPGGLHCFHMCKTGRCLADNESFAHELTTGTAATIKRKPYVKICIGKSGKVCSVTCIAKHDVYPKVWSDIYGQYSDFFNDLVLRYERGEIKDLYSYMQQPWCCAILHDRFKEYWHEAKKLFCQKLLTTPEIYDIFKLIMMGNYETSKKELMEMNSKFEAVGTHQQITDLLISFIHYNRSLLSMYAIPDEL